jgi:peroxiredoxin
MRLLSLPLFVAATIVLSPALSPGQSRTVKDLPVEELDGTKSKMADYLGQGPVYITFWALWCEPCKQELRAMKGVVERNKDEAFTLLAVNQDTPKSLAKVKAYVASQGYTFPVILDPNAQLLQAFNGQALPFSVLLGQDGKIIHTRTGYLPGDEKEIERDILKAVSKGKVTE